MNKKVFIINIIIFLLFCSCSLFKTDNTNSAIKGRVYITGNEPFTRLALEDKKGRIFYLTCDEKVKKELWKFQGKAVLIYYTEILRNKAGKFIKVIKYELIDKEK